MIHDRLTNEYGFNFDYRMNKILVKLDWIMIELYWVKIIQMW